MEANKDCEQDQVDNEEKQTKEDEPAKGCNAAINEQSNGEDVSSSKALL